MLSPDQGQRCNAVTTTTEALLLARWQFAFTVSFHIIFPAISIGLASYLAVLEGLWLKTQKVVYKELYFFWSKIFDQKKYSSL